MNISNGFQTDRRKRSRFFLQQGAYAAVSPYFLKLGPIVNISLGGIGFHYFIDRDQKSDFKESIVSLRNNKFTIKGLPFDLVSDFEINSEDSFYLKMMYCGIKFNQLTFEQFKQLDDFIIYNTIDIYSDRRSIIKRRAKKMQRKIPVPTESWFRLSDDADRRMVYDRRNYSLMKSFA